MSVNVLADRHHAGLFHSLQLLARRMGWTLYTPVGYEWWDEWYWSFGRGTYPDDRLAQQYLMCAQEPDGEYPDWPINFVTLEAAKRMQWGYVIASLQDNQMGFAKFAREMGATYVVQCGNTGQNIDWSRDPLVLNSSEMPLLGNGVQYHQEFDSGGVFRFREPPYIHEVRSFVHLLDQTACFPVWLAFRDAMGPDDLGGSRVNRYGHAPVEPDPSYGGNIKPVSQIARLMELSGWGWHDKPHGDGFGHVLHGWAAIGRPLIGHSSHYRGKMGEVFWTPETSLDLDTMTVEEVAERVRTISADEHTEMCRRIRAIFDEQVDYDREVADIARLLGVSQAVAA